MNHNKYDEIDSEEEEEIINNETAFDDIQPTFKELVLNTKRQLYDCIIKGPSIDSIAAQDNRLLIEYLTKLNLVYQLCKVLNTSDVSPAKIEKKISSFPMETRDIIKQLMAWLISFSNKNEYVDMIPYNDYLEVQLIRHPFVQK
jgi:hypothetical protein